MIHPFPACACASADHAVYVKPLSYGAEAISFVNFGIRITSGGSGTILDTSPAPVTTLQLHGNALITLVTTPTVFSFFNNTGATVTYGTSPFRLI
jgi:hypothetical protein